MFRGTIHMSVMALSQAQARCIPHEATGCVLFSASVHAVEGSKDVCV